MIHTSMCLLPSIEDFLTFHQRLTHDWNKYYPCPAVVPTIISPSIFGLTIIILGSFLRFVCLFLIFHVLCLLIYVCKDKIIVQIDIELEIV